MYLYSRPITALVHDNKEENDLPSSMGGSKKEQITKINKKIKTQRPFFSSYTTSTLVYLSPPRSPTVLLSSLLCVHVQLYTNMLSLCCTKVGLNF